VEEAAEEAVFVDVDDVGGGLDEMVSIMSPFCSLCRSSPGLKSCETYVVVELVSEALSVADDFDFDDITPPTAPPTTAAITSTSSTASRMKKFLRLNPKIFLSCFGNGGSGESAATNGDGDG
jgi:hypothetical protein